jgi:hypothetical protein
MQHATIIGPESSSPSGQARISRRHVVGAAGAAIGLPAAALAAWRFRSVSDTGPSSPLHVTSDPTGTDVLVDGHARGRTPLTLSAAIGPHAVRLRHPGTIPTRLTVHVEANQPVRLRASLWRSTPSVQPLQTPFPGTAIVGADFLANGDVVLLVKPPGNGGFSLWRRQSDGAMQRLGPGSSPGRIVARPDALAVAYLAPQSGGTNGAGQPLALTTLWTARADGSGPVRRYTLASAQSGEQLTDLSWSLDGGSLLTVAQQTAANGVRDHLFWIDPQVGTAQPVADLPTAVVPGSVLWGPDGATVALLTQTGSVVSLCLANVRTRAFRYLADLGQPDPAALPFPPLAWSPDGHQIVYAAGMQERGTGLGGLLLGNHMVDALFTAGAQAGEGRRLDAGAATAPVWRASGDILACTRTHGALTLDQFQAPTGRVPAVGVIPVTPASPFAVRWDAGHAQALLIQHGERGLAGWLLVFRTAVV